MFRAVAAFLIAPLAPLMLAAAASIFVGATSGRLGPALVLTLYSYPAALVLGVPLYVHAKRKGWLRWWQIVLQAALIGGVVPVLVLAATVGMSWNIGSPVEMSGAFVKDWLAIIGIGIALGGASGALFSLILGANMSSNNAVHADARHEAGARG